MSSNLLQNIAFVEIRNAPVSDNFRHSIWISSEVVVDTVVDECIVKRALYARKCVPLLFEKKNAIKLSNHINYRHLIHPRISFERN